jgi:flavin-dependent dehydrogenase
MSGLRSETRDVVIVGARCAGASAAATFARGGRRVVMLDRASFPADTVSTHLLWPGGVAELARVGALERVRALGAPEMPEAFASGAGIDLQGRFSPVDGIDYALCVRRPGLDQALIDTATVAGAELRQRLRVVDLIREGNRVAGVRYVDRAGEERELRASLIVGADGRRSTVASLVGTTEPYRASVNERACYYAYFDDPRSEWRGIAAQWRDGAELATAFPCDGGRTLVLLMPPVERVAEFREDLEGSYRRTIATMPGIRERLDGCELATKVRASVDTTSYFRRSSGPGWVLPGDAGHFKDPVTAQGIRDALRFGRLLGEAAAPVLDEPDALDSALLAWERNRERECLPAYQWTNLAARAEAMSPVEVELYRWAAKKPERVTAMMDLFSRERKPSDVLPARLFALLAIRALFRGAADRGAVVRSGAREATTGIRDTLVRVRTRLRPLAAR